MLPNLALISPYIKKVVSFIKKAFIVFIVYYIVINLFFKLNPTGIKKQTYDPIIENRKKIYEIINDKELNSTEIGKLSIVSYRMTTCTFIGEGCTDNPDDAKDNFKGTILGKVSNLIAFPFVNPPTSGLYWARSELERAGLIPKAFAAEGVGFGSLAGIKGLWMIFRNFTFLIIVLIMIAVGFMVMFRSKINPQTVVNIENALPKIAIALLLINFSYAIAGFMIDLMYISIAMIVLLLSTSDLFKNTIPSKQLLQSFYFNTADSPWSLLDFGGSWGQTWEISGGILNLFPVWIQTMISSITVALGSSIIIGAFGGIKDIGMSRISTIVNKTNWLGNLGKLFNSLVAISKGKEAAQTMIHGSGGTPIVGLIFAILTLLLDFILILLLQKIAAQFVVTLILFLSLLFIYIRIIFMLLSAYVNFIIAVVFSPIYLLFEAIPGKNAFSSWIKNLFLNLLTFPAFILLALVAQLIINLPVTNAPLWKPPFLVDLNSAGFQSLVGATILFSIPDLIKSLKELTGIKPLPLNLGFGSFFSGGQAAFGAGTGVLGQISSINLGLSAFTGQGFFGKLLGHKETKPDAARNTDQLDKVNPSQQPVQ